MLAFKSIKYDWLISAALLLITCLYAFIFYDFSLPPFEDAAMLIRYSKNLADGHGIVWNPGGPNVDGATDFLFMVWVSGLLKLGIGMRGAVQGTVLISHILAIILVFRILRKNQKSPVWAALLSACWLAFGPGLVYAESWFGTPFFALFALLAWHQMLKLLKNPGSRLHALLFAFFALLTGLIRPEGVVLTALMLGALLWYWGLKKGRRVLLIYLLVFGIPGAIYFAWHWNYFGYPLPNPFYVKGGGVLHLYSLKKSLLHILILSFPFIPAFIAGFRAKDIQRLTIAFLIPVFGFTLAWILMSNAMNYFMRFQYVMLPLILVSWYPLCKELLVKLNTPLNLQGENTRVRFVRQFILLSLFLTPLILQHVKYGMGNRYYRDGRKDLGTELRQFADRGEILATTEAGNLPLFSEWKSIDTWGLNDQHISHDGLSIKYLRKNRPAILMWHDYNTPASPEGSFDPAWSEMIGVLRNFVKNEKYELASCFGISPHNGHYYFVDTENPYSAEYLKIIREMDYYWYENGELCVDYSKMIKK